MQERRSVDVEKQTIKNTEDIGKITAAVSELALTMKYEMDRSKEERDNVKAMVNELRGINDKMGSLTVLNSEVGELKGEVGKLRHDLKNLENAQQAVPLLAQKVNDMVTEIAVLSASDKTCKEWRDKHDGAATAMEKAVKAMWAVCGAGVLSVGGFVLYLFFSNTTPTLVRHIGANTYTGQVVSGE